MLGLRILLVAVQVGLLLLLAFWIVDAAKLVRWALLVSSREAKDDASRAAPEASRLDEP